MKPALLAYVLTGALIGAILGHVFLDQRVCYASWNQSPYKVRWSFWGDCQLSDDGQNWMPEKAFMRQHAEIMLKH